MEALHVIFNWIDSFFTSGLDIFHEVIAWLVQTVGQFGYPGITGLMFLESSFFPFPSEVVVPPAGYLAWKGEMNLFLVIAAGIAGSLLGALFNYWIAVKWGRPFFEKNGKYFFISHGTLDKAEAFWTEHGHISTFTARLIPVIRQFISLPAGLARMPMWPFCFYTVLGSGIWVIILALLGYFIGSNQELINSELKRISAVLVISCAALIAAYIVRLRVKKKKAASPEQ